MTRYYLNCPACTNGKLTPKTGGSTPIYHCVKCDSFWQLEFDHDFTRVLKRFDLDSRTTSEDVAASIPDDWEGEPRRIGIREQQWNEVKKETSPLTAAEILHMIRSGDHFFLLDEAGRTTHAIKESADGTEFDLKPIQSPAESASG